MKTLPERFYSKVRKTDLCWLWQNSATPAGYGQFWDGKRRIDAHRFSYSFHKGEIPEGYVVMHICDVRLCVNPEHLSVGTQRDNLLDMYSKGRGRTKESYKLQSGELSWNSTISAHQADAIRHEYSLGKTSWAKLARTYGTSKRTIGRILHNERYCNA